MKIAKLDKAARRTDEGFELVVQAFEDGSIPESCEKQLRVVLDMQMAYRAQLRMLIEFVSWEKGEDR